jgi:hypothetical protein
MHLSTIQRPLTPVEHIDTKLKFVMIHANLDTAESLEEYVDAISKMWKTIKRRLEKKEEIKDEDIHAFNAEIRKYQLLRKSSFESSFHVGSPDDKTPFQREQEMSAIQGLMDAVKKLGP